MYVGVMINLPRKEKNNNSNGEQGSETGESSGDQDTCWDETQDTEKDS